jgi:PEGA domain-containing protein
MEGVTAMSAHEKFKHLWIAIAVPVALSCVVSPMLAQNQVMGEVDFQGATKVEKSSGVWVDGQYVGYLKELKGSKKILLMPGEHQIAVRQTGYNDYSQRIIVEPGQSQLVRVTMQKEPGATMPSVTATLKVDILPTRAAVFVDDAFLGHAGELGGAFHSMLISPGKHRIKVELPGYRTFETEVNLLPGQKSEIKTELVRGSIEQAGALIKEPDKESLNRNH